MTKIRLILCFVLLISGLNSYPKNNLTVRPEDFSGSTISEKISNAIYKLADSGGGTIIFDSSPVYIIDKAIELPSNTRMIVDGCKIKLADHVFDNIIRSGNFDIDEDHPYEYVKSLYPAHDIHIIGKNNAEISGSDQFYSGKNPKTGAIEVWEGDYWGWRNFSILFSHVKNFSIRGIRLSKTHSWGIVMTNGCQNGTVSDIILHTTVKNGDGISIIQGGSNIKIKNISGSTSDDTIVLAAFDESRWSNEKYVFPLLPVKYSDYSFGADIHDIRCENIHASGKYHVMIFLPSRPQIYNVICKNISDNAKGGKNAIIRFYGNGQYGQGFKPGNVHDISLKKIKSYKAKTVIEKFAPVMSLSTKNLEQENKSGNIIIDHVERNPDLIKHVSLPQKGLYKLFAEVRREDEHELKPGMPVPTRKAVFQVGNARKTSRIISDLDHHTGHCLGIFQLEKEQDIKIWLPEKIIFDSLVVAKYEDFPVPDSVKNYIPDVLPPNCHPRIWVTPSNIDGIKENLEKGENATIWAELKNQAQQQYYYHINPSIEEFYNSELEDIVIKKAFYYLMTKDVTVGKEVVKLMRDYYAVLEYGNVRRGDITREIGKSIYTGALVLDWCNDLVSTSDRFLFQKKMLDLARIMEVGWKPFKENVVNGHASEAQVNRDLLSMAISCYDSNPEIYKEISFLILERIRRMRAFEYQSPRHNQGFDYGAYRHAWEMRAAWIFKRMSGKDVFENNISALRDYWLYMRLPNGDHFSDGDRFSHENSFFPETLLLDYSYCKDGILKGEFLRRRGMERAHENPVLFLLLNDPSLVPVELDSLPHGLDFGEVLGGISTRTGWDMTSYSNDVFSDIRGGGYHFGNHQHSDAGSFQIYYHGRIITDIGVYMAYGTPYDFNFYKRSVSHNTILVKDPNEPLVKGTLINDGGSRFVQRTPSSPEEVQSDSEFSYGKVMTVSFAPNKSKPDFSYFRADLSSAYSNKIQKYTRSYCFVDIKRDDIPAAVIVADDISMNGEFPCFWKVNSLSRPEKTKNGIKISNGQTPNEGNAFIRNLLADDNISFELSSLNDTSSILGRQFRIRSSQPEANAYQTIEFSKDASSHKRFLNIIFFSKLQELPCDVNFREDDFCYQISFADRVICMCKNSNQLNGPISIPVNHDAKIFISDLKPGRWIVTNTTNEFKKEFNVQERSNSIFLSLPKGMYSISLE